MRRNPVAPVAELLLEPGEVRLDKVLASKDHPVGEVSNPTKQALGQRNFPILLFNDTLSSSQVKGRRLVCAPGTPFHKEVFTILAAEFLPGDGFRLAQNGSDAFTGKKRTLGKSLGVTAITVILGIITETGPDRVELDVSSHSGQCLTPFQEDTLESLGPEYPVAVMTLVVPLGKLAFEFFDKDRDVIHTLAIAIKQALDLSFSIRLLPIASDFLLEGLTACLAIAGFDPLKHLGLRERLELWDLAQQVEMIRHQHIGQNANAAKSLQAAHEFSKSFRLD